MSFANFNLAFVVAAEAAIRAGRNPANKKEPLKDRDEPNATPGVKKPLFSFKLGSASKNRSEY